MGRRGLRWRAHRPHRPDDPALVNAPPSRRREVLRLAAALPLVPVAAFGAPNAKPANPTRARVRPGDAAWPSTASWNGLRQQVGDALLAVHSPLQDCGAAPAAPACIALWKHLKSPYFLGDEVALTQALGWVDAWTSMPSSYAVAARSTRD